ncbi:MAG: NADH-quinone oxidoreductase subunit K [Aeropyrum sp.]|nr:NADH-quinone oxidoreductase subunit K [Aeropyrum sp.]MCE4616828.1 NADH-quinone oxidoreductase subunit K [Aeropyrum sp.]
MDGGAAQVVIILASLLVGLGAYGLAGSRNLVRQLISAEVVFNGILLLIIVFLSRSPIAANMLGILLTVVVAGEIIIVVAVIAALYRRIASLETSAIEEEGV